MHMHAYIVLKYIFVILKVSSKSNLMFPKLNIVPWCSFGGHLGGGSNANKKISLQPYLSTRLYEPHYFHQFGNEQSIYAASSHDKLIYFQSCEQKSLCIKKTKEKSWWIYPDTHWNHSHTQLNYYYSNRIVASQHLQTGQCDGHPIASPTQLWSTTEGSTLVTHFTEFSCGSIVTCTTLQSICAVAPSELERSATIAE